MTLVHEYMSLHFEELRLPVQVPHILPPVHVPVLQRAREAAWPEPFWDGEVEPHQHGELRRSTGRALQQEIESRTIPALPQKFAAGRQPPRTEGMKTDIFQTLWNDVPPD